jgi:dolichyl-phosphate-mannose-protein mannosyltransferase
MFCEAQAEGTVEMESKKRMSGWILGLLGAALLLRLLIAYVLLPGSGYVADMNWYSMWAMSVSTVGPHEFYAETVVNYPPGYIYVLWLLGAFSQFIAAVTHTDAGDITHLLIKIPPILLDVGSGFLLYRIAQQWCDKDAAPMRIALMVAVSYLFNPVSLYDSAIWGQTDAAGAFIMLLGIMALLRWPPEVTASIAVVSFLIKPQFGIVLIPLVGVVLLRRYTKLSTGVEGPGMRSHWINRDGRMRLLTASAVAVAVFYLLLAPFNLGLQGLLDLTTFNAKKYSYLTVNAFNPWALVGYGQDHSLMHAGVNHLLADDTPLIGFLTGMSIGTFLLAVGFLLGIFRLFWRSDWRSVILTGAFLNLCFFILPTRVHERYLFPTFVFTSLLIAFDHRWLWANIILAIGSFINLHAVLSTIGTENVTRVPFGEFFRSPEGIALGVTFQTAIFFLVGWSLWPGVKRGKTVKLPASGGSGAGAIDSVRPLLRS